MIGTPGFFGERLKEAREARGLSAIQLAELVGVTKQAVNLFERAKSSPAPETFNRISTALRFPSRFFLRKLSLRLTGPVFYRSLKSGTRVMRDRAERRYEWFRELTQLIGKYVELPDLSLPDFDAPSDPQRLKMSDIETVATLVRRHWRLGDGMIGNVVYLLESKGIPITAYEFEADELDAFSNWDDVSQRPFVILSTDKLSQVLTPSCAMNLF